MPATAVSDTPLPPFAPPTLARPLAIASGKGGTGKTFLTMALGYALAQEGRRVVVVDLDKQASATRFLGHKAAHDALAEPPVEAHGMTLFRGGLALADATETDLIAHVERAAGAGDTMLLDMPPDLTTAAHDVLFARPGTFWVVVPRLLVESVAEAQKIIGLAAVHKQAYLVVGNEHFRAGPVTDALNILQNGYREHFFDELIPRASIVAAAAGKRKPVTLHAPKSPVAQAVRALAAHLIAEGVA